MRDTLGDSGGAVGGSGGGDEGRNQRERQCTFRGRCESVMEAQLDGSCIEIPDLGEVLERIAVHVHGMVGVIGIM